MPGRLRSADDIRRSLGLRPHPEGGYYRETFRDGRLDDAGRAASTAIYFLLEAGQVSGWHRVDAAEVWHFYSGAPLELRISSAENDVSRSLVLGPDLAAGQAPQIVVPSGHWQWARSLGAWTLAGCTVAPGFTFDGFEMAPPGFEPGATTG
ncbi:MAG: cupin domain-containing protein [Hyphomicrobiaceae bacterium]